MKAKWFSFILLALCLVLALTGCDGGSGGGGNDSSITYIISDINPKDDISSPIESVSGGIKFTATESFIDVETIINDTITLKKDNTFSSTLKITEDGLVAFNTTFTGTWSGNDTSMTLTVKEAKENITGTTEAYSDTWTYVISDSGNTADKNEAYPATNGWKPTYTKQQ